MSSLSLPIYGARLWWDEPWFFKARVRGLLGWAPPVVVFVAFAALFGAITPYERASASGARLSTARLIITPVVIGLFFAAIVELPNVRRAAGVTNVGIICTGAFSPFLALFSAGLWLRQEIRVVHLLRPGEGGNHFGHHLMIIVPKHAAQALIGVPLGVGIEQLANTLTAAGIPVVLMNRRPLSQCRGERRPEGSS